MGGECETNKKFVGLSLGLVCIGVLVGALIMTGVHQTLSEGGSANISFSVGSVHATVTFYKDGVKVFEQYHAGYVTKLGLNVTFAKLTGNSSAYNMTQYTLNNTFVSIGNQGTLTADSVVLPGEWNRTSATMHSCVYNSFNLTAVFHPGAGPYTADCIGVNFESGIGNNALFACDTFTEVTGIDSTFTITVEFKISGS